MQTQLSEEFTNTTDGEEAQAILRKCVHCGFCNATCPTYQLLGDELDGPRGRIYLIKQVIEGGEPTRSTQLHLDRCLTCLNCQTTCPSGVEYGHLLDMGRKIVDARVKRPAMENAVRWLLKESLTSPLIGAALRLGRLVSPLLPAALRQKVAPRAVIGTGAIDNTQVAGSMRARESIGASPRHSDTRKVLLLGGCVQPALLPAIDRAVLRVLDRSGIEVVSTAGSRCCGAVRAHSGDQDGGLRDMRKNIDLWIPLIDAGAVRAIVSSASACALTIKDYGHALRHDPAYAAKAARVSAMALDLSELLPEIVPAIKGKLDLRNAQRLAFHPPCTLQHGQRLRGGIETHLRALGFELKVAAGESHLCCGSAGTYSILQPKIATQLRDRKLSNLALLEAQCIVSANVGCILHLQTGTAIPVKHWIEVLNEAIAC